MQCCGCSEMQKTIAHKSGKPSFVYRRGIAAFASELTSSKLHIFVDLAELGPLHDSNCEFVLLCITYNTYALCLADICLQKG